MSIDRIKKLLEQSSKSDIYIEDLKSIFEEVYKLSKRLDLIIKESDLDNENEINEKAKEIKSIFENLLKVKLNEEAEVASPDGTLSDLGELPKFNYGTVDARGGSKKGKNPKKKLKKKEDNTYEAEEDFDFYPNGVKGWRDKWDEVMRKAESIDKNLSIGDTASVKNGNEILLTGKITHIKEFDKNSGDKEYEYQYPKYKINGKYWNKDSVVKESVGESFYPDTMKVEDLEKDPEYIFEDEDRNIQAILDYLNNDAEVDFLFVKEDNNEVVAYGGRGNPEPGKELSLIDKK